MSENNIHKKLQEARVELQNMKLKKTGKNTYSNFTYYELGDILPAINNLCLKHGIYTKFSISAATKIFDDKFDVYRKEIASLVVTDGKEVIEFSSPTEEARIGVKKDGTGGADPIQNLGGKITYMRRYLMMMAFEIVESDAVDVANQAINEDLSAEDLEAVNSAETVKELADICGRLKKSYKIYVLTPHYERRREEILDNVKKVEK